MKNKHLFSMAIVAVLSLGNLRADAQGMAVNGSGSPADGSAMLDVAATNKGMLVPRMNASQVGLIPSPATGLLVYQTDGTPGFYYNSGTPGVPVWTPMGAGGGGGTVSFVSSGNLSPVFTSSVATPTTTPVISYSLSNAGAYSVLTNTTNATGAPVYGKVMPQTLYATAGSPLSTTFYRGDGQWATPAGGGAASYLYTGSGTPGGTAPTVYSGLSNTVNNVNPALTFPYPVAKTCTVDVFTISPIETATGVSQTVTATVYVNGSATPVTVSISTPAGGAVNQVLATVTDNTHTTIFNPGDIVTIRWDQTNFVSGSLIRGQWMMHVHE